MQRGGRVVPTYANHQADSSSSSSSHKTLLLIQGGAMLHLEHVWLAYAPQVDLFVLASGRKHARGVAANAQAVDSPRVRDKFICAETQQRMSGTMHVKKINFIPSPDAAVSVAVQYGNCSCAPSL